MTSLIILEKHEMVPIEPMVAALHEVLKKPPELKAEVLEWPLVGVKTNPIDGLTEACEQALRAVHAKPEVTHAVYFMPRTLRDPLDGLVFQGLIAFMLTRGNFIRVAAYASEGVALDLETFTRVLDEIMTKLSARFPTTDESPEDTQTLEALAARVHQAIHLAQSRYAENAGTA